MNESRELEGLQALESAENGDSHTTIYDPELCYTAWMTVPDSLWTEVEQ